MVVCLHHVFPALSAQTQAWGHGAEGRQEQAKHNIPVCLKSRPAQNDHRESLTVHL